MSLSNSYHVMQSLLYYLALLAQGRKIEDRYLLAGVTMPRRVKRYIIEGTADIIQANKTIDLRYLLAGVTMPRRVKRYIIQGTADIIQTSETISDSAECNLRP